MMLAEDEGLEKLFHMYEEAKILGKTDYKFRHLTDHKQANRTWAFIKAVYMGIKTAHPSELRVVEDALFAKYVHSSNAIEGNSLTLDEVQDVLFKTEKAINKSVNELLQTRNHFKVKELIAAWAGELDHTLIKEIHKRMMDDVDGYGSEKPSGEYRTDMVRIDGGFTTPSKPEDIVPDLDRALSEYIHGIQDGYHPIECAAVFHFEFERIHPFRDGNGRTGRAILDFLLKRAGFPSIYIPTARKRYYLNALQDCRYGVFESLVTFLFNRVVATFQYFMGKTSVYHLMMSEEVRTDFERLFGKELAQKLSDLCNQVRSSEEDP